MSDFTDAEYAAAIPACCSQETMEAHYAMLLCWGLAASLRKKKPMNCDWCDLRKPDALRASQSGVSAEKGENYE
jgi:hypothetical protein